MFPGVARWHRACTRFDTGQNRDRFSRFRFLPWDTAYTIISCGRITNHFSIVTYLYSIIYSSLVFYGPFFDIFFSYLFLEFYHSLEFDLGNVVATYDYLPTPICLQTQLLLCYYSFVSLFCFLFFWVLNFLGLHIYIRGIRIQG